MTQIYTTLSPTELQIAARATGRGGRNLNKRLQKALVQHKRSLKYPNSLSTR